MLLWDAIFADSADLHLVEHLCVAMLLYIRSQCLCDRVPPPFFFDFFVLPCLPVCNFFVGIIPRFVLGDLHSLSVQLCAGNLQCWK